MIFALHPMFFSTPSIARTKKNIKNYSGNIQLLFIFSRFRRIQEPLFVTPSLPLYALYAKCLPDLLKRQPSNFGNLFVVVFPVVPKKLCSLISIFNDRFLIPSCRYPSIVLVDIRQELHKVLHRSTSVLLHLDCFQDFLMPLHHFSVSSVILTSSVPSHQYRRSASER